MLFSRGIASPIEFPKESGIRIGAVSYKTAGKKFSLSYRVNLPAAMTGKGRVREIREREAYRVKLFMDLIDQSQKGLVSCATQEHALAVRDLINQMKKKGSDPNYYVPRRLQRLNSQGKELARSSPH